MNKLIKTIAMAGTFLAISHGVFSETEGVVGNIKGIGYTEKTITHKKKRLFRKPLITTETIRIEK